MEQLPVVTYLSELFWVAAKVASPILLSALVVGLVISIFQVVTQIQEMTLTFVPKLIIVLLVIGAMSNWLLDAVNGYATYIISQIAILR